MAASVRAENLGIRFLFDRQSRVVTPLAARLRRRGDETWGLRRVTFAAEPGEGIALVGASGSGKTTLLRAIAGVLSPDEGQIAVRGRVGSLLSLGAGLTSVLTGRENVLLLGVLAGLSRRDVARALDEIRERAELKDEFDHPVSSYSQGMRARLGFSVAVQAHADVLVLDEVHEALDYQFRSVLEAHVHAVLRRGGLVLATGHDHPLLERMCRRALLLRAGGIAADGRFDEVVQAYVSR